MAPVNRQRLWEAVSLKSNPHRVQIRLGQGTTNMPRKNAFLAQRGQLKRSIGALTINSNKIAAAKASVEWP